MKKITLFLILSVVLVLGILLLTNAKSQSESECSSLYDKNEDGIIDIADIIHIIDNGDCDSETEVMTLTQELYG